MPDAGGSSARSRSVVSLPPPDVSPGGDTTGAIRFPNALHRNDLRVRYASCIRDEWDGMPAGVAGDTEGEGS